ncbi:endospore germination permease [Bacillus shivajii]|uniref:GerAB/ArcD/ProY family transporter n=1 Tax=Bacillus shivajii TaxID=1983719 RepID=UPI001CFA83B1|nr:endospore germination permease [Bacillus shivajii]UCZ55356.1 endospore germination permease [Bacillus shivajii]
MKNRESINATQLAYLLLVFLTGSAIVNIPAPVVNVADRMGWLALLISISGGAIVLACVIYLHKQYKSLTFIEYSRETLGNKITIIVIFFLIMMLFLMLGNIVHDIGLFLTSTMYRETPQFVLNGLALFVAALTARAGIEVMARMFTLLIFVIISVFTVVILLLLPEMDPSNLLPLFPEGIKPVLHGSYITWGFPYAELFIFSMLLPFTYKKNEDEDPSFTKKMYAGFFVSSLILFIVVLVTIMILGPTAGDIKYSLFFIARLIDVKDILTRVEVITSMIWIVGSFMKATIVLFILNLSMTKWIKIKDDRILIFPISFISLLLALTMYEHELEFALFVADIWPLVITTFGVFPLLLIFLITVIKRNNKKHKDNESS